MEESKSPPLQHVSLQAPTTITPLSSLTTINTSNTSTTTASTPGISRVSSDKSMYDSGDETMSTTNNNNGNATTIITSSTNPTTNLPTSHLPACRPCAYARVRCDDIRPCTRCTQIGEADECVARVPYKRGRPRGALARVKRGGVGSGVNHLHDPSLNNKEASVTKLLQVIPLYNDPAANHITSAAAASTPSSSANSPLLAAPRRASHSPSVSDSITHLLEDAFNAGSIHYQSARATLITAACSSQDIFTILQEMSEHFLTTPVQRNTLPLGPNRELIALQPFLIRLYPFIDQYLNEMVQQQSQMVEVKKEEQKQDETGKQMGFSSLNSVAAVSAAQSTASTTTNNPVLSLTSSTTTSTLLTIEEESVRKEREEKLKREEEDQLEKIRIRKKEEMLKAEAVRLVQEKIDADAKAKVAAVAAAAAEELAKKQAASAAAAAAAAAASLAEQTQLYNAQLAALTLPFFTFPPVGTSGTGMNSSTMTSTSSADEAYNQLSLALLPFALQQAAMMQQLQVAMMTGVGLGGTGANSAANLAQLSSLLAPMMPLTTPTTGNGKNNNNNNSALSQANSLAAFNNAFGLSSLLNPFGTDTSGMMGGGTSSSGNNNNAFNTAANLTNLFTGFPFVGPPTTNTTTNNNNTTLSNSLSSSTNVTMPFVPSLTGGNSSSTFPLLNNSSSSYTSSSSAAVAGSNSSASGMTGYFTPFDSVSPSGPASKSKWNNNNNNNSAQDNNTGMGNAGMNSANNNTAATTKKRGGRRATRANATPLTSMISPIVNVAAANSRTNVGGVNGGVGNSSVGVLEELNLANSASALAAPIPIGHLNQSSSSPPHTHNDLHHHHHHLSSHHHHHNHNDLHRTSSDDMMHDDVSSSISRSSNSRHHHQFSSHSPGLRGRSGSNGDEYNPSSLTHLQPPNSSPSMSMSSSVSPVLRPLSSADTHARLSGQFGSGEDGLGVSGFGRDDTDADGMSSTSLLHSPKSSAYHHHDSSVSGGGSNNRSNTRSGGNSRHHHLLHSNNSSPRIVSSSHSHAHSTSGQMDAMHLDDSHSSLDDLHHHSHNHGHHSSNSILDSIHNHHHHNSLLSSLDSHDLHHGMSVSNSPPLRALTGRNNSSTSSSDMHRSASMHSFELDSHLPMSHSSIGNVSSTAASVLTSTTTSSTSSRTPTLRATSSALSIPSIVRSSTMSTPTLASTQASKAKRAGAGKRRASQSLQQQNVPLFNADGTLMNVTAQNNNSSTPTQPKTKKAKISKAATAAALRASQSSNELSKLDGSSVLAALTSSHTHPPTDATIVATVVPAGVLLPSDLDLNIGPMAAMPVSPPIRPMMHSSLHHQQTVSPLLSSLAAPTSPDLPSLASPLLRSHRSPRLHSFESPHHTSMHGSTHHVTELNLSSSSPLSDRHTNNHHSSSSHQSQTAASAVSTAAESFAAAVTSGYDASDNSNGTSMIGSISSGLSSSSSATNHRNSASTENSEVSGSGSDGDYTHTSSGASSTTTAPLERQTRPRGRTIDSMDEDDVLPHHRENSEGSGSFAFFEESSHAHASHSHSLGHSSASGNGSYPSSSSSSSGAGSSSAADHFLNDYDSFDASADVDMSMSISSILNLPPQSMKRELMADQE